MRKTTTCHAEYLESTSPESVEFTIEYLGEKLTVFISSPNTSLYKSEEALVSTTFLPCLMKNMNCTISGAISQTFKKGLRDIYKTTRGWGWAKCDGSWNDIEERNNQKMKGQRTGLFFSGGVDSFYTLLKHRNEISDLIYIDGFDRPLSVKTNRSMIIEKLRQAADEFGKNLIELKTNIRDFSNKHLHPNLLPFNWAKASGSALATIAHSLSGDFNKIFIAASDSFPRLPPLASHPDIDPKWSSDQVKLLHDGCEATRLEKNQAHR